MERQSPYATNLKGHRSGLELYNRRIDKHGPGAPTGASAIAGNGQVTITFNPPASNGGSPITSYTVTSSPGSISAFAAASPITVGNLSNGVSYTFTVTATNAMGIGPASTASNSATTSFLPIGIKANGSAHHH